MSSNGGRVPDTVLLAPNEDAPGRPFTSVGLIERDMKTLLELLADVRGVLREAESGIRTIEAYQRMAWKVDGLTHRLIVCDESRLRYRDRTCVVGFFGERRPGVDPAPLEEANSAIVTEFTRFPGILSYSSVELPSGKWANLVLHDDPDDREQWRQSEMHAKAAEFLSPLHYKNVRIHNAELTDGLTDRPQLVLERTKYYDFEGNPPWRAQRELMPA